MITRRRVLVAALLVVVVLALLMIWQAWSLYRDLDHAERSADELRAALDSGDEAARDRAIGDLRESADAAAGKASRFWWDAATVLPFVGDDAEGVQVLSTTLADVADAGLQPLVDSIDRLDELSSNGRIDVDVVRSLQVPVAEASEVIGAASREVESLDGGGFMGPLRNRYDLYSSLLQDAAGALSSAETATRALPTMVGAEGPRDYLLLFQNNAEIRATGGIPGSWALIHAEGGRLSMTRQGSAQDFPHVRRPVVPITDSERAIYGDELATYFQDPGFTPDFPRAAEIWRGFWNLNFNDVDLDGVIAIDPVSLSYLLEGTGPVSVGALTLTADNLLQNLLYQPYVELDEREQNLFFQKVARSVFDALTHDLESPIKFVEGLNRATRERRFLVAPFVDSDVEILAGSRVLGLFRTSEDSTPAVDIGLNDATGSKMSYFLRYRTEIKSLGCTDGTQRLDGNMVLSQAISPAEAAALPESVTGGGTYGTDPGSQLVVVRIYGPVGGTLERLRLEGKTLRADEAKIAGRPVATVAVLIASTDDLVLTWSMTTGPGQTDDVELHVTPGVNSGTKDATYPSSC